jgi:phage terminase small subunit
MAGVKGKSGGARPGTGGARPNSGGARPGAGRKKKEPPVIEVAQSEDPKAFLLSVMNDQEADARMRLDAAKSLMPFMHVKLGEGGKKDESAARAKKASTGRFAPSDPPKLAVVRK